MKRILSVGLLLALDEQAQMAKQLEDKRRRAEEAQLRLQQEREEAQREHERMMERAHYEKEEREKIVSRLAVWPSSSRSRLFQPVPCS